MKGLRLLICAVAILPAVASSPQDLGTPGPQAVKLMTVPPGFQAHLFACEPAIRQPNAFCIDDRGRLWVAENFSYTGPGGPWKPSGRDTILIFEDTDGDGKFDKRTVFADNLSFVSGLEVGYGGVWVGSPPNLLFIPDRNGDDKPDGPPVVVLDGWGHHDQHETLNSFTWGPDGWLYGCHGVFTHSKVGKPGAPDNERTTVNAAIWRYHPIKQIFEKFAEGTSNPWGVDFDTNGQMFIEACVIPHLWYIIQGGRYHRQGGQHENKYTYEDIKTIADHKHDGIQGRKGGHAHGGARFVMNDVFPPEYQGKFIVGTIHHHGMYTESFERQGSGFVGKHVGDFLMANDPLYLGFNHEFGPDGGLYVIDWYDPRPCHGQTPAHIDTGRIYKITYGDSKKVDVDLSKKSSVELVKLQLSPNEWYVRHSRRLLMERGADPAVHNDLKALYASASDVPKKLRLLWTLHDTGGATEPFLLDQLKNPEEYIRGWAVQLLLEDRKPSSAVLKELVRLAKDDPSPVVRLYVTAAAQRVATSDRWEIVEALATHAEDSGDHNLPSMLWYATEPLVMQDNTRAVRLAAASKIPRLRELITRRIVAGSSGNAPPPPPSPKVEPAKSVADTALVLRVNPKEVSGKQVEIAGRSGVAFDGHESHLVYPHAAELSFKSSDSFTISAWVHLKEVPQDGWKGVVTKSRDSKPWYGLWIEGEGRWVFGGNRNLMGPSAVTGWQHVCGVQEGGKRKLFVNGSLCATGAADDGSGSGELWIGGAKSTHEFLEGVIGDVRIYGRALDASEVAHLAQNP